MRFRSAFLSLLVIASASCGPAAIGADPVRGPVFTAPESVYSAGDTAMIPLRRGPESAAEELAATVVSGAPRTVEVLRQPLFLAGQELAFVRVRALRPGRAELRCGDAVLAATVSDRARALRDAARRPSFLAPAEGAFVSGNTSVAVEISADPRRGAPEETRVDLVLPSGKTLAPVEQLPAIDGPVRRFRFAVNRGVLPAGPATLVARAIFPDGTRLDSDPLRLFAGNASATVTDECENHLTTDRPQTFGDAPPLVASDAAASGSQHVTLASKRPVWRFHANIPEPGDYQLYLVARGSPAAGSFPAVRLLNVEDDRTLAGGAVAGTVWHRAPVGRPFPLKTGEAVLGIELANEMNVANRANRAVFLDRFELVQVPAAAAAKVPRVAFAEPVDGAVVTGPFRIRALVSPEPAKGITPPALALVSEGTVIARSRQDAPVFHVDPSRLKPGSRRLQLQVLGADGAVLARSVEQRITVARTPAATGPERSVNLAPGGPGWSAKGGGPVRDGPGGAPAWLFAAESSGTYALPAEWCGNTTLEIELRGDAFEGQAVAELELIAGDARTHLGALVAGEEWRPISAGSVYLPPGPKLLQVRFANDRFESGKGDRNLRVAGLKLRGKTLEETALPTARIAYPPADATLGLADAVILETTSPAGLRSVEILMDGKPFSWAIPSADGLAPVVAPLPLRGVTAGPHVLSAVVTDHRGGRVETAEVRVQVDPEARQTRYLRIVRLLDQFAYGPEPRALARALLASPDNPALPIPSAPGPGERAALEAAETAHPGGDENVAIVRAITQTLLTPEPARMRFVLWAENHFSTWIRKTGAPAKWAEHLAFWQHGPAPFSELLRASATSPAMLLYLDQQRSFAGKLNENYARELLELHTLGVDGGYTQADVTALAGLLTGWTAQEEYPLAAGLVQPVAHYRYAPYLNDGKERELLGLRTAPAAPAERYDRALELLELLAGHPSTSRFVTRKLATHYAGAEAAPALSAALAPVFVRTGGDMQAVLEAACGSPLTATAPPRVGSPADYAVRLCRVAGIHAPGEVRDLMLRTGRALFDRSTPDGYPEGDRHQADSNLLLQKWAMAARMGERMGERVPRPLFQGDALTTPEGRQRLLDWTAIRFTGRVLGERSNAAGLTLLESKFAAPIDGAVQAAVFVAQCPEAQLR